MKNSIGKKIIILVITAMVSAIAVTWLANALLLPKYYNHVKTRMLKNAYVYVSSTIEANATEVDASDDMYSDEDELNSRLKESLQQYGIQNNLTLVVITRNEGSFISRIEMNSLVYYQKRMSDYIFADGARSIDDIEAVIYECDEYAIYRVHDRKANSDYIELISVDKVNDRYYLIRTELESVGKAAQSANLFLAYTGVLVTLIVILITTRLIKSFTKPIKQLSEIAGEMAELNFDVKYEGKSEDEIGELGQSINVLSEKLERTISELKSANTQLQRDIEEKQQIDDMRKEFLSGVSHELKTPLALIQGYAEGLKDNINDSPEDRDYYCDVIMDEASRMNRLVNMLINLNKLEFGTVVPEFERFDITELVKSVMESMSVLAEEKNISVSYAGPEHMTVWADEFLIEDVVTNYLSNAFNHIGGNRKVNVNIVEKEGTVRVSIFNNGTPIPEAGIEKIWIKFYKVDKARTREYGGSGLGLSIVKAVMDLHQRKCGAINHEDGVEFWFELDSGNIV